jgi:CDP-glucose 4,6-dehydratase
MGNMEMKKLFSIFKNKRVLVTGDTGFKGSWLTFWLNELGAEVAGYALPPLRTYDNFHVLGINKLIKHIDGDIRDYKKLEKVFKDFKPEILFHLAAQPLVRFSYNEPKYTFDVNVGGAVNILELVKKTSSLKSVVYITSDKCYKNQEWIWGYRESDELGGRDPYSSSKSCAELVFYSYFESFFKHIKYLGIASARAGNVIGGGDWSDDRIVPDCIRALKSKKDIIIRNPNATRPWQHVLEPLSGYLLLGAKLYKEGKKYSSSWNFGPNTKSIKTVKELTEKIIDFWGYGKIKLEIKKNAPHEAGLLHLNCDKSNQMLNWYSKWDFDKAIEETVKWYKAYNENKDMVSVCKKQIEEYMNLKF